MRVFDSSELIITWVFAKLHVYTYAQKVINVFHSFRAIQSINTNAHTHTRLMNHHKMIAKSQTIYYFMEIFILLPHFPHFHIL